VHAVPKLLEPGMQRLARVAIVLDDEDRQRLESDRRPDSRRSPTSSSDTVRCRRTRAPLTTSDVLTPSCGISFEAG